MTALEYVNSILAAAAPIIRKKTLIDRYMECGDVAPFLGLSSIMFLWLFFICALWTLKKQSSFHFQLLLPSALLPVMIGLFGSSLGWYVGLDYTPSPSVCDPSPHYAEVITPLVVGSFLSMVFIFLSLVICFINGSNLAKQQLTVGTGEPALFSDSLR